MKTTVIYTSGTLGDHLPFIALGQALSARGYRVRLVINQAMHPYAERAGLEAIALTDIERGPAEAQENAWAWDHWHNSLFERHPQAKPFDVAQYLTQARELIELCREADLLISTSIRTLGFVAASALELPWLTVSMNPYTFWQPTSAQERETHRQSRQKEYNYLKKLLDHALAHLGIDKAAPPFSPEWLFARHVLLASSPHFSRPDLNQLQPQASLDMTGFWFYEDPDWSDWQPDEELAQFCRRRPLALAFSSQPLENPQQILAVHVEAAAQLDRPLLVQRGWAGFSEEDLPSGTDPANIMFADFMPHDWLFARAACAIQHGGIGSIARALRQGCPLLIEPFGNDQLYNASRVIDLGVGVAVQPFKMTVDGLVQLLSEKALTPDYRQRAEAIGAEIRGENGLETACQFIERYLERVGPDGQHPKIYERFAPPLTPRSRQAPGHSVRHRHPTTTPVAGRESIAQRAAASEGPATIPKILHQTWKDSNLPPALAMFHRTWRTHHPDWTFYLWTDEDNREFLRRHYSWFLPIYDNYPEHIMRVDAVRYFILYHYGGVYVDLDFECVRPLEPLLTGKQVVLGLEPEAHLDFHFPTIQPLPQIVCNAFMASQPRHPFWEHMFRQLLAYHRAPDPLNATGPFALSRAHETYPHQDTVSIVPADLLYPVSSEMPWPELTPEAQTRIAQTAYGIHHWQGNWWRGAAVRQAQQAKVSLLLRGTLVNVSAMQMGQSQTLFLQMAELPRVSCLMVTQNRPALAQRSVRCFQQQSYPNRELMIVDDGEDDSLERWIEQLGDERLCYVRLPAENRSLGELRNIAVERSSGEYIAQWDDDDLSDPRRLELQLATIHLLQASACFLERQQIWWPERRRLALSNRRIWEGSFICLKAKLPPYPDQEKGEDTPVIKQVVSGGRVAVLDLPQLYVYVFHGANTFAADHWEAHWLTATASYEGDMYDIKIEELQKRLQLDLSPWLEPQPAPGSDVSGDKIPETDEPRLISPSSPVEPEQTTGTEKPMPTTYPKILILTPVKDAVRFLPHYWENLKTLTFPHDRISLAFLESDSTDGTYTFIEDNLPDLQAEFATVKLFKRDYGYRSALPRWEPSQQFQRRSTMAKSRNYLLARALEDEAWVLWIDVDVAHWPDDVIEQLLATKKEIVVPNCLSLNSGDTFDYNTFKLKLDADQLDWSPYIIDGILQPPQGYGRLYLSDLPQHDCVEIDAVGGTMLLIRADIHREGLIFPTFSYKLHLETEGLALMAKDMGYRCWGLPKLEIIHP